MWAQCGFIGKQIDPKAQKNPATKTVSLKLKKRSNNWNLICF